MKGEENRRVGRAHGVEDVPRDQDHVGTGRDDLINRAAERLRDIGLPLIQAIRGLAMILAEAEVQVGEMGEFHWSNSKGGGPGGKRRPDGHCEYIDINA